MAKDFKVNDFGFILADQAIRKVRITGIFKSSVLQADDVTVIDTVSYALDGSGTRYPGTVYSSQDELIAAISTQSKPPSAKSADK